jgi:hypothetical protein
MQNISDTTLVNKTRKYYDVHPDHGMRLKITLIKNKVHRDIVLCEPGLRFLRCQCGIIAIFDETICMN